MGRRKNKNRHQKTHPNSKVGQKAVYFANDQNNHHPISGNSNSFPPHGRSGPPRHGGNNSNNNNRGQGPRNNRNQHRDPNSNSNSNSNFNAYNPNNAPNANTRNRKPRRRGDPNSNHNHNHNHNTINGAEDLDTLLDAIAASPFSSIPPPHSKPGARSCTECSGVRRANLRFRNWAHAALLQCGERFAAWAEDAGVGFAGPDEMDWQPEPVIRVLLVDGSEGERQREQQQKMMMMEEQYQQQQQQQQYLQNVGNIGPIPCPGPWPWPPWCDSGPPDPSVWPVRVPSCGLPVLPGVPPAAASEVLPPPPGPECCVTTASPPTPTPIPPAISAPCFGNAGVCCPTPVPGCGIVGAGAGGVGGVGGEFSPSGRVLSPCPECDVGRPKETVSIPTRTVMEQSATTGTCGPTFRPWGARRRSSCEGTLCCG